MTEAYERSTGLGRGLAALIPQRPTGGGVSEIAVSRIERNPYQPRQHLAEPDLEALAESIRRHGVIQPILVTETIDGYRLIAGERRLRAAEMAGLERIPALVRQTADHEQLELALVENLQREDLGPIETAHAYRRLIDEFGLSHDEIAGRVGRARPTIVNTLRLLELDPTVQAALEDGSISEGHGRALGGLPADAQPPVLRTIVDRQLSVRDAEELVRRLRAARDIEAGDDSPAAAAAARDPEVERVEEDLRRALGTKVKLTPTRRGGRIVIEYFGDEELARIYERLIGSGR